MTTNTHDTKAKQPERERINSDVQKYLDQGKMIEILGTTPIKPYNPRGDFSGR